MRTLKAIPRVGEFVKIRFPGAIVGVKGIITKLDFTEGYGVRYYATALLKDNINIRIPDLWIKKVYHK